MPMQHTDLDEEFRLLEEESRGNEEGVDDFLGDEDAPTPAKYQITSYGADPTVEVVVNRLRSGNYFVPSFQRQFVWSVQRSSSFIESLLLGLPVPGIFLSKEIDGNRYLIIDGQQRLKSLQFFYDGVFEPSGREFRLVGVAPQLQGKSYKELDESDRITLDDAIIHSTIIKQDDPEEEEVSSIYHVFRRINGGAVPLTPQEIRFCISNGAFTALLADLNGLPFWRKIYGSTSKRMKDQELILRFFAMLYSSDSYSRPMQSFLDKFLFKNRKLEVLAAEELKDIFAKSTDYALKALGSNAFRPSKNLNVAVLEAVLVATAFGLTNRQGLWLPDTTEYAERYKQLIGDASFVHATTRATADEANVKRRLELAKSVLLDHA